MTEAEAEAMGNTQYEMRVSHITVPRCPYCTSTTKQRCYATVNLPDGGKIRRYECGNCHHPAANLGGTHGTNNTRYIAIVV